MRRIILLLLGTVLCVSLFAEFTPYGSVRVNYFFNMYDKDYMKYTTEIDKSRTINDYMLSASSCFGFDYELDDISANIEFAAVSGDSGENVGIEIFTLWAKYQFDGFSLLAGKAEDGTSSLASQVWGEELGLIGYGYVYGDANPQIRFELDNGLYFALIKPYKDDDPIGANYAEAGATDDDIDIITSSIDAIIPKINLGWDFSSDDSSIMLSGMFQMYKYDKDFSGLEDDFTVMSWLVAVTGEFAQFAPLSIQIHSYFGQNIGNMGYEGSNNGAVWAVPRDKLNDPNPKEEMITTTNSGCFISLGYDFSESFNLNAGWGASYSENDYYFKDDACMGVYLQGIWKLDDFSIIPELGMMMDMDDPYGDYSGGKEAPRGNTMYGGVQLRYDF